MLRVPEQTRRPDGEADVPPASGEPIERLSSQRLTKGVPHCDEWRLLHQLK